MWNQPWNEPTTACQAPVAPAPDVERPSRRRHCVEQYETIVSPWSSLARRGRGTIRLELIEYRIFKLLASRPNYVFTPRRISEAVSTSRHLVTAETLRRYITSLRHQLGFFSDYIQTVPFMGYRFKG